MVDGEAEIASEPASMAPETPETAAIAVGPHADEPFVVVPPPLRDMASYGLVAAFWLLALIAAFGFEMRLIIGSDKPGFVFVLLGMFLLLPLGIAVLLARLAKLRDASPLAPDHFTTAAASRALELGAPRGMPTRVMPDSTKRIDAFCAGIGRAQTLYVTVGLLRLAERPAGADTVIARFLIDRALAGAAAGAGGITAFVRAIWIMSVIALPIKFLILLGGVGLSSAVYGVFPINTAVLPQYYLGGHLAMALGLIALYAVIVRRTVFLVDHMALEVAPDRGAALQAFTALAPIRTYGLHGKDWFRPNPAKRLQRAAAAGRAPSVSAFGTAILLAGLLVAARFALAHPVGVVGGDAIGALSALTVLTVSIVLATSFTLGEQGGLRIAPFMLWVTLISAGLAGLAWAVYPIIGPVGFDAINFGEDVLAALRLVGRLEWVLLALSLPLVLGALALGQWAAQRFFSTEMDTLEGRFLAAAGGGFIALLLLWATMLPTWPLLQDRRAEALDAFDTALERSVLTGPRVAKIDAETLATELFDGQYRMGNLSKKERFQPPLAFLALWQAPLRARQ